VAYDSAYYHANKEACAAATRRWSQNNPDKVRAASRRWKLNNPEQARELERKWRRENPEKIREAKRKWAQSNPEKVKAKSKAAVLKRRERASGFTKELFAERTAAQRGLCLICGVDLLTVKACADHDHRTGDPRGVLCSRCNTAIGFLQDDPARLRAAAKYLEFWRLQ